MLVTARSPKPTHWCHRETVTKLGRCDSCIPLNDIIFLRLGSFTSPSFTKKEMFDLQKVSNEPKGRISLQYTNMYIYLHVYSVHLMT